MGALGHGRFVAAGSDWGTSVSALLGERHPGRVAGVHLVPPLVAPDPATLDDLTRREREALDEVERRSRYGSAYSEVHRTVPQTIGYALVDSPVALCAWLVEKLCSWADPAVGLTRDQMLDTVTLYWLTGTGASAARLYWESIDLVSRWLRDPDPVPLRVPTGASVFGAEAPRPSRRWAERRFPDLRLWREHERGGHFPALEAPDVLVDDSGPSPASCGRPAPGTPPVRQPGDGGRTAPGGPPRRAGRRRSP